MRQKDNFITEVGIPLLALLVLTSLFYIWKIDIIWQEPFYRNGDWFLKNSKPFELLYDYGPIPAFISGLGSLLIYFLSFILSGLKQYRKRALFVFLYLLIGSGIIVNAVLKEYWGRPRPRQIVEFGGEANYVPPAKMGEFVLSSRATKMIETEQGAIGYDKLRNFFYKIKGKYNSFPCGHASVGFFMMFPYFLYRKKRVGKRWLYVGIILGSLIGFGRNVQGGHFLSDNIWAGFIMYFTGLVLYHLMKLSKK